MAIPISVSGKASDKVTTHGYERVYQPILDELLARMPEGGTLVEFGVQDGASMDMWTQSLPKWKVYGFDYGDIPNPGKEYTVFKGDQRNTEHLKEFLSHVEGSVGLIVDDGSHIPEDQLRTFNIMFPRLEHGGKFVIEDVEVSYWSKGDCYTQSVAGCGVQRQRNVVEACKLMADYVNRRYMHLQDVQKIRHRLSDVYGVHSTTLDLIASVCFTDNCIVLTHVSHADVAFMAQRKPYRWWYHLTPCLK